MSEIIYGIHPLIEALKSPYIQFQKILIGKQNQSQAIKSIIEISGERGIPVTFTDRETIERIVKVRSHQNIVGIVREIGYSSPEEILHRWRESKEKALFLILDGIQDPQNFGSLIRTASGFGVHGIIIPKDRAVGITSSAMKASTGAIAHMPIVRVVNLSFTIDHLKEEGLWVYGAEGDAKERINDIDFNIDLAIVIGSEGKGIRPLVKRKCDRLFSIPMKGPITSFNVSVSGGIILYEVIRQRSLNCSSSEK